jgi:hypothetical protein
MPFTSAAPEGIPEGLPDGLKGEGVPCDESLGFAPQPITAGAAHNNMASNSSPVAFTSVPFRFVSKASNSQPTSGLLDLLAHQ